jgi:RimJ/RimL family protein N-acetyltransferase
MLLKNIEIGAYVIRNWRKEDAASIVRYASNRKIWINLRDAFPHPYTQADAEAFLFRAMQMQPGSYFAIASDIEAIGSIGLMAGIDVHRFTAELGYWLAEPFWGNGIMTAAIRALSEYAFAELGFHRIFAEPYTTNAASARVLEKAGFAREGIMKATVFKDGKIRDQYLYAKVNESAVLSHLSRSRPTTAP